MCCVRSHSTLPVTFAVLTKLTESVDGAGFLLFFRQLSQLYQGLGSIDPPPHHEPRAIKFAEPLKPPSPLWDRFGPSDQSPWEQPERQAMEFVAFRLTAAQLTEIHNSVTKGIEHPKTTRVDAVVGLLARCLSEVEPESRSIDTISYVVDVRAFFTPRATRLISPSTAEWVYTRSPQWLTRSFCSLLDYNPRKESILTATFSMRHRNPQVAGEVEGPRVGQRHSRGFRQNTVSDRVGGGGGLAGPKEGCLVVNITRRWVLGCSGVNIEYRIVADAIAHLQI